MVRDQKKLYELLMEKGIGSHEPAFYVSFALYFEKYERNFKQADEMYRRGILKTRGNLQN